MIYCSAIVIEGEYPIIITGKRHSNCLDTARDLNIERLKISRALQGFITTDMLFLDRVSAAKHALKLGQIKELKFSKTELFSEDLY